MPLSYRRLSPEQAAVESALAAGLGGPLRGVGVFDEYMYAWPERICVDTALDAERRGAAILTYTEVTGVERSGDGWQVTIDERAPEAEGRARIRARMVVNAAGPWIDRVLGGGRPGAKRVIGVKGVNVMVRLPDGYRGQGLEAFSSKGEPFYVFPWREHHFIGPTETVVTENPDNVRVEDAEIDYVLGEANRLFPDLGLTRAHVQHCWCGVRPTSTLDGTMTSLPVRVAEDPEAPGLMAVTGSTIMLHRHAGRMAARAVEKRLGKRGERPREMIAGPNQRADGEGVGQMAASEHVVRLSDLIRRRLPDGLNPTLGRDRAEELSRIAAASLGWSDARRQTSCATSITRRRRSTDTFDAETAGATSSGPERDTLHMQLITYDDMIGQLSWAEAVEALRAGHRAPRACVADVLLGPDDAPSSAEGRSSRGLATG